jgi:hypothetical protein
MTDDSASTVVMLLGKDRGGTGSDEPRLAPNELADRR